MLLKRSYGTFSLRIRDRLWVLDQPQVMGILNVTPDSFSDGGEADTPEKALYKAEQLLLAGAEILDIGAVSTRPGAPEVSQAEELRRLLPALRAIRRRFPEVLISIDTFRSEVAHVALEEGADLINDISGGAWEPDLWQVVARYRVPYVLMHIQGTPQTMQRNPSYENVVEEVWQYFVDTLRALAEVGVYDVILDPGFGFGKTLAHNYTLLRALPHFRKLRHPLLIGLSRKSMLWRPLDTTPKETLWAATALHWEALLQGVSILRVHDPAPIRQIKQLLSIWSSLG